MIRRITTMLAVSLSFTGCATFAPSIPENYRGPTAYIEDSAEVHSNSKADFFVVEAIDGVDINNSVYETRHRNHGRGMLMTPYVIGRPVVAGKPLKIELRGRTEFAAPIQALTSTVYQVQGTVEFTPEAEGKYVVRGELGDTYSAVWLEDAANGQPIGSKVEIKGSAALDFFEK